MRAALVAVVLLLAACTSGRTDAPTPTTPQAATTTPTTTEPATIAPTTTTKPPPALTDWPTYHGDPARTGASVTMPAASGQPRLVASLRLDAAVYAAPIVGDGRIYVATENNSVYALDERGHRIWHQRLGSPSLAHERPCGNISPLGITGTPVYADGTVYVAAEYGGPPRHELVALSAVTGTPTWRVNIDLPGADRTVMQQRGALTIADGRVWVPFGGLAGDCGAYKGRVVGVATTGTGSPIAYTVPTTREAGIWTPPGPSWDGRRLYVSVGNGEAGTGDPYDHSDSILALRTDATLADSFSPRTWAQDNEVDADLGSQGPALVGPWIFIAGKSGTAYVLRRDHLGGIGGEVSSTGLCRSFGGTAVVRDVVFVPCTDGVRAVRIDGTGHVHVLWHAAENVAGSPVVGGDRVWAVDAGGGALYALDPATGRTVGRVTVGETSRFATPALSGRYVLVSTLAGMAVVASS